MSLRIFLVEFSLSFEHSSPGYKTLVAVAESEGDAARLLHAQHPNASIRSVSYYGPADL
jgi:hypothetical protein